MSARVRKMAISQLKNGHFQFEKWPFFCWLHAFFKNEQTFFLREIGIGYFALTLSSLALGPNCPAYALRSFAHELTNPAHFLAGKAQGFIIAVCFMVR